MNEADEQASTGPTAEDSGGEPVGREPWLRFAITFGALAIAAEVLYYTVTLEADGFHTYLTGLAWVSGRIMAFFGSDAVVHGTRITSRLFAVEVAEGCDAIQVCSLLAAAVVAFPVELSRKLRGLIVGVLVLQFLNLLRIISLFQIGAHYKEAFQTAHEVLWPGALIVATIVIWIAWVRFETQPVPPAHDA